MAELINVCNAHDGDDELTTTAAIDANYKHLTDFDPTTDSAFVERDGRLVAYSRTDWREVEGGPRKYYVFAHVHPELRETGLEESLLAWSEARSAEISAGHETTYDRVYETWADQVARPDLSRRLESSGYRAVAHGASMLRPNLDDIPHARLPEGVECRPVRPEHLRAIWEADNEAFRDHWGFSEGTEEDWGRFLDFPHRDESLWKVAWTGDRVVGQVRSFINHDENAAKARLRGYTEFISTAREWRRRGVASALIAASLRELAARGMTEAALGVHVENRNNALKLYEELGFRPTLVHTTYHKPVPR